MGKVESVLYPLGFRRQPELERSDHPFSGCKFQKIIRHILFNIRL